jgi:uncharacterized membrane protein
MQHGQHNGAMHFNQHISETTGSQRLVCGLVAGIAALAVPLPVSWQLRGLLGWCVGVAVYLLLAWWLCIRFDAMRTRERAQAQDEPSVVIFLLLLLATLACVMAIALMMQDVKDAPRNQRIFQIVLFMVALGTTWLFIQAMFAFHYAHRYYQTEKRDPPGGAGLQFPGKLAPDYFDFMYFSHVVGMTSQVSDVQVTSRAMRQITLAHSVLSFAFNIVILALSINVIAGALN